MIRVHPTDESNVSHLAYVKKWLRLNGINLNKIPLDSEIWVEEIDGEQHVFFESFVEHRREYRPGKPGRVTFVMDENDEMERETQQRRLTCPWAYVFAETRPKAAEPPPCRCGHRENQHQDDTGPGDGERSWRHPYTPKEN